MNVDDAWERMIATYVAGAGVINFRWDQFHKRFFGVHGFRFARMSTGAGRGWAVVPDEYRKYVSERNNGEVGHLVLFVVNKRYGPFITDAYVVMKLDGFTQMLTDAANGDPERYYGKE
jgi:hypothetical protein